MAAQTIAAVVTPPGVGGVGIARVSGPLAPAIARGMIGRVPPNRLATLAKFRAADGTSIDQGIALYFQAPRSYTGEHVLELQAHGGPVVLDLLVRRMLELGARPARPGEFSERAFLNGKLDLAQAEAVADLIESTTEVAARLAVRTLQGALSTRVDALVEELLRLRTFVEAAIDFPQEEIDFLCDSQLGSDLRNLLEQIQALSASARQGRLVREGVTLVIAGPTNAGKSSLLNRFSDDDAAIVSAIPGTTRDLLRQEIQIDGLPLHLIDTAGLRQPQDPIEEEGVRRARLQMERADRILWVFDDRATADREGLGGGALPPDVPVTLVRNKIDLTGTAPGIKETAAGMEVAISVRTGAGMKSLRRHLKRAFGFQGPMEGQFIARRRHLEAMERARRDLAAAMRVFESDAAAELIAEDLRKAQQSLASITGEVDSEALLGRIFSGFCIGK